MLKITNKLLKEEAERRNWKVEIINELSGILRYTLPSGKKIILQSLLSPYTSTLSVKLADDKYASYKLAVEAGVPVAETHLITTNDQAAMLLEKYKKVVVKPLDSAHGNGVTTNVTTNEQLIKAMEAALLYSSYVLLQPQVDGEDMRLLFIGGNLAASCVRVPAQVIGDGEHTLRQLIDIENENPERGQDYEKRLNLIDIKSAERYLGNGVNQIPSADQVCKVVGTANIGTGGTAEDKTEKTGESLIEAGKKMLAAVGLQTGAVDFIAGENEFYFLELNANPSIGLHTYPSVGTPQPVARIYLDWIEGQLTRESSSREQKN